MNTKNFFKSLIISLVLISDISATELLNPSKQESNDNNNNGILDTVNVKDIEVPTEQGSDVGFIERQFYANHRHARERFVANYEALTQRVGDRLWWYFDDFDIDRDFSNVMADDCVAKLKLEGGEALLKALEQGNIDVTADDFETQAEEILFKNVKKEYVKSYNDYIKSVNAEKKAIEEECKKFFFSGLKYGVRVWNGKVNQQDLTRRAKYLHSYKNNIEKNGYGVYGWKLWGMTCDTIAMPQKLINKFLPKKYRWTSPRLNYFTEYYTQSSTPRFKIFEKALSTVKIIAATALAYKLVSSGAVTPIFRGVVKTLTSPSVLKLFGSIGLPILAGFLAWKVAGTYHFGDKGAIIIGIAVTVIGLIISYLVLNRERFKKSRYEIKEASFNLVNPIMVTLSVLSPILLVSFGYMKIVRLGFTPEFAALMTVLTGSIVLFIATKYIIFHITKNDDMNRVKMGFWDGLKKDTKDLYQKYFSKKKRLK